MVFDPEFKQHKFVAESWEENNKAKHAFNLYGKKSIDTKCPVP